MRSYAFCPITESKINERVTRVNAVLTLLMLIAFALTQNVVLMGVLAVDFFFRAIPYSKFSLVVMTSRNLVKYFPDDVSLINAGPKIFAARIGALITVLIVLSMAFSLSSLAIALTGLLGIFAFLEGAFGICVACKIYPYLYDLLYK